MLTASDLAAEQAQARERQWLHNRALHGDGIAAGLEVTVEWNTVHVAPGVAIDVLGREIVLTAPRSVDARSVVRESHGRVQVIIAWAEEPADEVVGPDGPVPGRFVERPRVMLAEHALGEAPEHAVPLAAAPTAAREQLAGRPVDPSARAPAPTSTHRCTARSDARPAGRDARVVGLGRGGGRRSRSGGAVGVLPGDPHLGPQPPSVRDVEALFDRPRPRRRSR